MRLRLICTRKLRGQISSPGVAKFEANSPRRTFQIQNAAIVEGYCDLGDVFEVGELPGCGRKYVSYQLLRNVLAAHALDL